MEMAQLHGLTIDYGRGKGIFNLSFSVNKGEIFGFIGPNGAVKTTTIRNLLGFIKPQKGTCKIAGLDCFKNAGRIQKSLGYLPGEIAFFDDMDGLQFLHFISSMKKMRSFDRAAD